MKSQVLKNVKADPDYCPYCLRCSGLVRMVKQEPLLWSCKCGALHDERGITSREEFDAEMDTPENQEYRRILCRNRNFGEYLGYVADPGDKGSWNVTIVATGGLIQTSYYRHRWTPPSIEDKLRK